MKKSAPASTYKPGHGGYVAAPAHLSQRKQRRIFDELRARLFHTAGFTFDPNDIVAVPGEPVITAITLKPGAKYKFEGWREKDVPRIRAHAERNSTFDEGKPADWPRRGEYDDNFNAQHEHAAMTGAPVHVLEVFEEFGPEQVRDEFLNKIEQFKALARELGAEISEGTEGYTITIDKPRHG